jgi:hypothetical protein
VVVAIPIAVVLAMQDFDVMGKDQVRASSHM